MLLPPGFSKVEGIPSIQLFNRAFLVIQWTAKSLERKDDRMGPS